MTSSRVLVAGTRGSRLALRQTDLVVAMLLQARATAAGSSVAEPSIDIREIRTEGDRDATTPLSRIGGQGVFVKELERALVRGEIDFAVHSLKDVPAELAAGCLIAAVPPRADPRDALVSRSGAPLAGLPAGARVGTGSARRAAQLRATRPDVEPVEIRGNVDTRIRKVDDGEFDAAVLAVAGLERLGLLERASEVLEPDVMLPAVGQGALAVEARADDAGVLALLATIDDHDARLACEAERAFLSRLGGGCRLPFGALATVDGDEMRIEGFIANDDGSRSFRDEVRGRAGAALGTHLAERLLAQGASEFVEALA